jgi:DNA-binding response OmpR family regulator
MGVPKVLIIDDNESALTTLSGLLRLEGFATETADTGYRGIELALAGTADVILVDLHLPDVSGIDVVRTLKASGVQALVIMTTVFPDLDTSHDAASVGADYIEGLLSFEELLEAIVQALRGRARVLRATPALAPSAGEPAAPQPSFAWPMRPLPQDQRVRRVVRAVEADVERPWPTSALAMQVRLSESRLRHLFADIVGISLSRFVRERRLLAAARLLITTSETLQAIATRLHLPQDLRAVRTAFRDRFGMSPRAYRAQHWRPSDGDTRASRPRAVGRAPGSAVYPKGDSCNDLRDRQTTPPRERTSWISEGGRTSSDG